MRILISTQLIPEAEVARIEAEASITAASMKLHSASREALRCRSQLSLVELAIGAHVRQAGLNPDELLDYFIHRASLANSLAYAKINLIEAEDAEASAEFEWESAVNHLTSLLQ